MTHHTKIKCLKYELVNQEIIQEKKMVDDVWSLLEMTPYRYKTSQVGLDRVKQLERLEVTFEFVVTVYKKYENNSKKMGN